MKGLLKPLNKLRRSFMQIVDKGYIRKKIAKRRGKCMKCGECCSGCKFLDEKTNLCKVYGDRPGISCYRGFPLDRLDQKIFGVEKTCGYKF